MSPPASGSDGLVLVLYDIRSDRRLARTAKRLKDFGVRAQKSVFHCDLSSQEYDRLKAAVIPLVDAKEDSLRFYRLCASCAAKIEFVGAELPGFDDTLII